MSTSSSRLLPLLRLAARLLSTSSRGAAPASWACRPTTSQQPSWLQQRGYAAQGSSSGGDSDAAAGVVGSSPREPETPLLRSIRNRIMIRGGPLTLAEYMSEVLTNPLSGYYTSAGGEVEVAGGAGGSSGGSNNADSSSTTPSPSNANAAGRSVFGSRGDFVTSPEISQLFGEMICIWSLALWLSQGRPQRVRLVELGPGRGTLMADVLRAAKGSFPAFAAAVRDVRLVELSPALRAAQWRTLQCESLDGGALKEAGQAPPSPPPTRGVSRLLGDDGDGGDGSTATTRRGVPVTWHASLDEVPGRVRVKEGTAEGGQPEFVVENDDDDDVEEEEGVGAEAAATAATTKTPKPPFATIYIAHEFFDALPVHQFQYAPARGGGGGRRKGGGVTSSTSGDSDSARLVGSGGARDGGDNQQQGGCWLERMVDIVPEDEPPYKDGLHLRFVLSPSPTPASALLVQRRLAALTAEQRAALASSSSSSSSPPSPGASSSPPQPSAIEISAHGMAVAEALALRVGFSGGGASSQGGSSSSNNSGDGDKSAPSTPAPPPRAGAALILDYGRGAPYSGSLTAVRAHAQHPHPLSLPGAADLSAWVDFSALEQAARESGAPVSVHGPVEQGAFLGALGARARAEALAVAAADGAAESAASRGQGQQGMEREARRAAEAVAAAYRRLVGGGQEGMGETYKAFAIVPRVRGVVAEGGEGGGGTATATAPVGFGGGVADAASL